MFHRIAILLALVGLAIAAPLSARTICSVKVTEPTAHTSWTANSTVTVKWTIEGGAKYTKACANATSSIVLGSLKGNNEHLELTNVTLGSGSASFVLPASTKPRNNAIVVVFGDSGDRSKTFKIVK